MGSVTTSSSADRFHFDPAIPAISVGDRTTLLDSRAAAIFALLQARAGERVGKDELLSAAWPNQVVHENSLAKAISKLRRALAGSGLEIAPIYGVGYCLRAAPSPEANPIAGAAASAGDRASRWPLWAAIAILSLVLAATLVLRLPSATALRTTPPATHDPPGAIATILWVDDHPANNRAEVALFRQRRIAVHLAETSEDAMRLVAMNDYRLVISDLGRGEDRLAGLKLTQALRERGAEVPIIIYTIRPSAPERQAAQRRMIAEAGASDLALTPSEVREKVLGRVGG
ncbi:response regulator [Sphingomonas astaxanthinifaciens]|uniref:Response regulator n=1 Tax=Sphingomonas astaxanthinifaciens DSM 22298 TaxID=1123267 RepID=A0ABQ5Z1P3_9SPHN|nr:response regulator [Sphingomonas astaxanthinifaciens]GLR46690.1 hypothetical protein GCM10007925_04010 [Sphingomonas astaxanthinifaciens DSM 22298]